MTDIPGFFAAFAAGLVSFLSPCVLPLVPIYLSFITGESAADLKSTPNGEDHPRKRMILSRTLLFVAGFSLVFVALAIVFGGGMRFVGSGANVVITRIGGIIVAALALNLMFDFVPFLRAERRISRGEKNANSKPGRAKALLFGMAFAAGWTPCVGPILSSILLYAGSDGNVPHAAALLAAYSAGLGLPFILAGTFLDRAMPALAFFKRHATAVRMVSAAILLLLAIPMLTGSLSAFTVTLQKAGYAIAASAENGPGWWAPAAKAIAGWFMFTGL
jgi:cytochrome c-type biogenesis protein